MNFQKTNNITGWIVFTIALAVYWITMEETASYWDCGEFIAVSYKLEVPHPPGAPLFLLIGRMFSFLSFGDVTKVAYWINFTSVLSSAFTILFLFWSIVLFGRKLLKISNAEELSKHTLMLMGAGAIGALAYTFSDSFWFSAVEAEVYAMSSFFTAFVVWAMLKWDVIEDESKANRWLILMFYMIGLSIGVHLLNLVTLPALGLIFYFKKYKPTTWGVVATLLISGLLIILINDLIIPGLPTIAGNFEIFFVNTLGLPFGSGVIVFSLIIIGALVYGVRYSQQKQKEVLNTFLLSSVFILIGYASYAVIVIRSNYDTPINENAPKDIMTFVGYLKREQYGSRPLLYGEYYTAEPIGLKEGAPIYKKGKDKYEIQDRKMSYDYDPKDMTILPRIYSRDPDHRRRYQEILGLREGEKPKFSDNIRYMFSHQIGWMYARYFMFNFAGRESDEIGGNWLHPSDWFENISDSVASNKARNNFFMIPFLLGLIGMFYQTVHDQKNMAVVGLLFILTGVALVVYLNGPPAEPRERDYIYAASYYAYCFWIGFAVIGIAQGLVKVTKNLKVATIAAILLCSTAPALMAAGGWNDHDRSGRYFSVDSAVNYLESCGPNAVIFTGGDNDTFPLWYSQEVEGIRTDMRVIVLSYYNTDWYIQQSMRKHYESEPLPYTLSIEQYRQGGPNDYLPYEDLGIKAMDLKQYIELLSKDYKGLKLYPSANVVPTKDIVLTVDVEKVKSMGIIPKGMDSLVVSQMVLKVRGNALEKKDLALLDVLLTNNWERPLYVNNTSLEQFNIDLRPYTVVEGNAYRILPVRNPNTRVKLVNTEVSYENIMKKFKFRGLDDPTAYFSEDYRNFVLNHRGAFNEVAEALLAQGEKEKARDIVLYGLEKMPDKGVPYDVSNARNVEVLFEVGEKEKAIEVATVLGKRMDEMAAYYLDKQNYGSDLYNCIVVLGELQRVLYVYGEADLAKKYEDAYEKYASMLQMREGK
jgi:tetratricopeptide (TPR) repeat protein